MTNTKTPTMQPKACIAELWTAQFDEWNKYHMICLPGDGGVSGPPVTRFKDGSVLAAWHPLGSHDWTMHAWQESASWDQMQDPASTAAACAASYRVHR